MNVKHWLRIAWWKFLLARPFSFRAFFCRMRGHPYGVVWFNPSGFEPDMTCRNCGDDLDSA